MDVAGDTHISSTTASTSSTTGALTVAGGLGVSGDAYVEGDIRTTYAFCGDSIYGEAAFSHIGRTTDDDYAIRITAAGKNQYNTPTSSDHDFRVNNVNKMSITETTVDIDVNCNVTGVTTLSDTTASSSTSTGALVVSGGVGIAGAINTGSTLDVAGVTTLSDTTASSSISTGALVVSGGVGVADAVNIGNGLYVSGQILFYNILNMNGSSIIDANNGTFSGTVICGTLVETSDKRVKKDIKPLVTQSSHSRILQLEPVSYKMKSDDTEHDGLIAQDVEKHFPNVVTSGKGEINGETVEDARGIHYSEFVPHLIASVQELQRQITAQQAQIEQLQAQLQK